MSDSKYKVWHIPQVPMEPFEVFTNDLKQAVLIMDILAEYDDFQYRKNIKPDYSNIAGVSEWNEEDQEWYDVDEYKLETL